MERVGDLEQPGILVWLYEKHEIRGCGLPLPASGKNGQGVDQYLRAESPVVGILRDRGIYKT